MFPIDEKDSINYSRVSKICTICITDKMDEQVHCYNFIGTRCVKLDSSQKVTCIYLKHVSRHLFLWCLISLSLSIHLFRRKTYMELWISSVYVCFWLHGHAFSGFHYSLPPWFSILLCPYSSSDLDSQSRDFIYVHLKFLKEWILSHNTKKISSFTVELVL